MVATSTNTRRGRHLLAAAVLAGGLLLAGLAVPGHVAACLGGCATFPVHPPTSTDQCKDGGWQTYKDAQGTPAFKNQGDCVSFVNTGE